MIQVWLEDIKEGYRLSSITMDLPHSIAENLQDVKDSGNQTLPLLIDPSLLDLEPRNGLLPSLIFANKSNQKN